MVRRDLALGILNGLAVEALPVLICQDKFGSSVLEDKRNAGFREVGVEWDIGSARLKYS